MHRIQKHPQIRHSRARSEQHLIEGRRQANKQNYIDELQQVHDTRVQDVAARVQSARGNAKVDASTSACSRIGWAAAFFSPKTHHQRE